MSALIWIVLVLLAQAIYKLAARVLRRDPMKGRLVGRTPNDPAVVARLRAQQEAEIQAYFAQLRAEDEALAAARLLRKRNILKPYMPKDLQS